VDQVSSEASTSKGGKVMGNVIFVLAVVAFWAIVFSLVVFLIRMSISSHNEEQVISDTPEEYYESNDNTAALT
jgi:hypothetical protein